MIKKIPVSKLRVGMYVARIDRGWLENPFFRGRFEIVSQDQIDKFAEYNISDVYIDTSKGLDVLEESGKELEKGDPYLSPSIEVGKKKGEGEERRKAYRKAGRLYKNSLETTRRLMNDVRLGRLVDAKEITDTVENLVDQILNDQDAIVGLGKLQDYDDYTYTHSLNVCIFCLAIGRAVGYSKEKLSVLGAGALAHDFGKMLVPKKILNKPGKLTAREFVIMKEHVIRGVEYLRGVSGMVPEAIQVALEHHERYSGRGYPQGLKGEKISEFGKIAAVVDVYDAITSDRVYHRGMVPTKALRKIYEWRYHDFDPVLVELFIKIIGIYPLGSLVRLSDGSIGMVIEGNPKNAVWPKLLLFYDQKGNLLREPVRVDLAKETSLKILESVEPKEVEVDIKKAWDKYLYL